MAIRTEEMLLTDVEIAKIKPEVAPLPQEKSLKKSLIVDEGSEQVQPVMLRHSTEDGYDFEIIDGRRRVETLRQENVSHVRAIIVANADDKMLHVAALIGNSGRPNPADEAEHMQYLRDKEGMTIKEIAELTEIGRAHV